MNQIIRYCFEVLMLVLLYLCLRHARGSGGWPKIWQLLAGVVFGWLLEWATIMQLNAYEYGPFLLKIGPLPLSIGIGWGVIIYTARLFSDASSLPVWVRPLLDALLALNIDLTMDALAIRLGMWDWGRGLSFEYFGVPLGNFWAWFWVVFSFSLSLRLLLRIPGWSGRWLAPLGAILLGTIGVLGSNALIAYVLLPAGLYDISIGFVFLAAILITGLNKPAFNIRPVTKLTFWIPAAFHGFFLAAGLISGVILEPPFLLGVSILMLVTAWFLHRITLLPC